MRSIIYWYIDKEGQEKISIGNRLHFDNVMKDVARQLVWIIHINHNEEFWNGLCNMSEQELYSTLLGIGNSSLYKYYPN